MATATLTMEPAKVIASDTGAGNVAPDEFNAARHNGEITITNPATGGHRTLRIRTILDDGPLRGQRVVELLTGPDNETDYTSFGFVIDGGRVSVWRRYRGEGGQRSQWERLAALLMDPAHYQAKGAIYTVSGRCRKCNRLLTDETSCATGLGPVCGGRSRGGRRAG